MSNYTKKAITGIIQIFTFTLIGAVGGYLSRIILARKLTIEEFGLFFAVFGLIQLLETFRSGGIFQALVKYIAKYKALKKYDEVKTVIIISISLIMTITILTASILLIFSKTLSINYFKNPSSLGLLLVLIAWFFFRGIQDVIFTIFYGFQKIFLYCLRELRSLLFLLILLIMFIFYSGVMPVAYSWLLSSILIVILFLPKFLKITNLSKHKIVEPKKHAKKIIKFSIPVFLTQISESFLGNIDIILLTYFLSVVEVGIYSIILPTALLLFRFSITLVIVSFPISAELWAKGKTKKLRYGIETIYKYLIVIVLFPCVYLFIFAEKILSIIFGAEYVPGVMPFRILLIGILFGVYMQINNSFITSLGHPTKATKVFFIGTIFNITSNIILIPKYGMVGAAITTLFSYLLMVIINTLYLKKIISYSIPIKTWFKTAIMITFFTVFILSTKEISPINSILSIVFSAFFYGTIFLIFVLLFRIIKKKEIKSLYKTFRG